MLNLLLSLSLGFGPFTLEWDLDLGFRIKLDKLLFQGFDLLTELHCDEIPLVVSILSTCHQSEGNNEAIVFCLIDPHKERVQLHTTDKK